MSQGADDLRRLLQRTRRLARRSLRMWPLYLVALALAAVAAVLAPQVLKPMYESSAVLVYREMIPTNTLLGEDAPIETPRQRGARLREMLLARANLEEIIDELGLYPEVIETLGKAAAVDEFLEDADCRVGEDTFAIKFQYHDAGLVQAVTKRLAQSLMEKSARYRVEQASSTTKFLEAQRDKTKRELAEKEQKLARFLAAHPEFAQDVMAPGGMAPAGASIRAQERKAAAVDPAIEALKRQRARVLTRLDSIDDPDKQLTVAPPADIDPHIARALENAQRDFERARDELAQARGRYTAKHPDVRYAESRLARAKAALEIAQQAAAEAVPPARAAPPPATEKDRNSLRSQLSRVEQAIAAARREADDTPGEGEAAEGDWIVQLETEWSSLNREVHDVRERYEQIQRRYFQASILDHVEASGGAAQMMVVDPAYLPERPARRGPRRVGAAGAAAVLILFGMIIGMLAYVDDRLYDLEDLQSLSLNGVTHAVPPAPKGKRHG